MYTPALVLIHFQVGNVHINRMLMHNGEINTIKGNVNWMRARQNKLVETLFEDEKDKVHFIVDEDGSDSSIVDNAFLSLAMEPEKQRCY